ncbi:MAG: GIY-YIG nuclease family protein [Alphaproteobacteria bacterium]|nr:GIY-YIG nuclease family protein [Alphaproteobacteria bacterium]
MNLTEDELLFLSLRGWSAADVFDGRDMLQSVRRQRAEEQGKQFMLGFPCKKAGHRLRTRSNHCIRRNPSALAYQERHKSAGFVYIAHSQTTNLVKVGMTRSLSERQDSLSGYAGVDDWIIHFHTEVRHAGLVESRLHAKLKWKKATPRSYVKDGRPQFADEIYLCSVEYARRWLIMIVGPKELKSNK